MSNDSWFADPTQGAELHQAAAAFRSIETRLPQFRVTTNGHSAVIDASGSVIAGARIGERVLVVGDVPVREPPRTLMVAWGDWVGRAGAAFLALLGMTAASRRWRARRAERASAMPVAAALPADVVVLPPAARLAAGLLRAFARGSLLWMAAAVLLGDGVLQTNTLAQIRTFVAVFLAPEAAAWCVLLAFAARASIDKGALVLARGSRRLELGLQEIVAVEPWRVPLPGPGVSLRLASGERWRYGLAHADPAGLSRALAETGGAQQSASSRAATYAQARVAIRRGRLDQPLAKFVLFPFALAIPAFRLHQHIAYGSAFGEYYSFGLTAYLTTFALWWAAWAIGVVLFAAALRTAIEVGTVMAVMLRPAQAAEARRWLEVVGLAALYVGLPVGLLVRVFAT
jgi:apolipoprotein N-acyltransferase